MERFWSKVAVGEPDDCWIWQASRNTHGYGQFYLDGHLHHAHRVSYELRKGPIPEGLQIDHVCCTKACVNPAHLDAVTHRENALRHFALRTECFHGHPLDGITRRPGRHPTRYCKTCNREKSRRLRAQQAA